VFVLDDGSPNFHFTVSTRSSTSRSGPFPCTSNNGAASGSAQNQLGRPVSPRAGFTPRRTLGYTAWAMISWASRTDSNTLFTGARHSVVM
jgi:hypothetical protein